jgi:hypothetical protein
MSCIALSRTARGQSRCEEPEGHRIPQLKIPYFPQIPSPSMLLLGNTDHRRQHVLSLRLLAVAPSAELQIANIHAET